MQFWAMVVDSLRESMDRKIFWVMAAITVLVTLAMLSIGFESDRVTFVFGFWEVATDSFSPVSDLGKSRIAGVVVYGLMDFFLGTVGMVLMLVATGSMLPGFLERGCVDILLAKPIGRGRLFFYRYLTGLVFVLIHATLFVVLTFLASGIRWNSWFFGYLLSIPLVLLLFSYLYCVSALVAVKTGSAVATIMLSIAAWVVFAIPANVLPVFDAFPNWKEGRVYQVVRVASWIPPKTADIPYLAARWAKAGTSMDILPDAMVEGDSPHDAAAIEAAKKAERRMLSQSPLLSIGSSLLFEAVVVLWAMFSFSRKDF